MSNLDKLMQDITNSEITKQELQKQLDILTKEYEVECSELTRLHNKNLEYSSALKEQERLKQIKDDREQREQDKATLKTFVNELYDNF